MVTTDTGPGAVELRNAVVAMAARYGLSAARTARAQSAGRREDALRHRRARQRRYAAIQRLADALAQQST